MSHMRVGVDFPFAIYGPAFWPSSASELFGPEEPRWPLWSSVMRRGRASEMLAAAVAGSCRAQTVRARNCHIYAASAVLESFSEFVPESESWFRSTLWLARLVAMESPIDEGEIYLTRRSCQERLARAVAPPTEIDLIAGVAYHLALLCAHHRDHPRIAIKFAQGLIDYALLVHAAGLKGPARQTAMLAANVELAADLYAMLEVLPGSGEQTGKIGEFSPVARSSDSDQEDSLTASSTVEVNER